MDAVIDEPLIVGTGTPEEQWQAWPGLHCLPECELEALVPHNLRAVLVAPHPDDEVLACGGLLAMLAARGSSALIIAVTDGDASHPGSTEWPPARLAQRRHAESVEGLRALGLRHYSHVRLSVPDGAVASHHASLVASLHSLLTPDDIVFSTWSADGHPDHEATAVAVAQAGAGIGFRHVQVPIWMWHWAEPADARVPWHRLVRLPVTLAAMRRKSYAIEAHVSQLTVQDTGAPAVLSNAMLERLLRLHEYLLLPEADA